ncbi:MAG: carbohydrate kinase family protein [Gemmatimonadales bacterium]
MPCLAIVGTFIRDRIFPAPAGEDRPEPAPTEDWGGIVYSLEAFETAREDEWTFLPIAKVGEDVYDEALTRVQTFTGVRSLEGLRRVPEPNNRVDLYYHDAGDRCERLRGGVPGWAWDELAPLVAGCDAVYLNFISGWELDLPAARALRRGFAGPIYADIHSLLLGIDDSGVRVRRSLPDWPRWVECFDWAQGNADEIAILTGEEDPLAGACALVAQGAEAAFCTLGQGGAAWATRDGMGRSEAPEVADLAASNRPDAGLDPTGCGDVWGATCVAALLAGRPVPEAVRRANHFAAAAARHHGTAGLARALGRPSVAGSSPR